jgi:hypothetical protein
MPAHAQKRNVDRRRILRQKSFLRGTIHFNNRRSALDCLVRDISRYGARLIFSDAATVPDAFDLHIPQKDQTLRSHVIWRHGQEVGAAFADVAAIDGLADADLIERLQRLETEVASLRRMVRQLKSGPHEFEAD